ncbi:MULTISPECIES: RNA-binding protein [unclassified Rhizobium]|uniref:RNA-binding protein n=1 Tax=unclassified Rhizobium TaxID=2613769 RepID=UPI000648FDC6|nr:MULTISPECIES: RNA-binding protein [unclassified Rhizobium]MBO9122261.1 RNA-binding protein [Rhizobium sp. 16-488-2b]MBO9172669.1 RNA-binding protein [Rhizobium sp. 16-488-2a]MBO9192516.1 RNA-binding protein [Rhizobium sp. 16-449-1b]
MSAREPTVSPEDDDLAGYDVNGRMCIVTRESGSPDELIRFVAAPDGTVVADLKRQLPGRGCWVKIDRALVDKAVAKKSFARALKTDVKAAADLGETVDKLLMQQLMQMMNMARKAGQFITGASKVDAAIRSGAALAVFHATDAAADGVRKIDQARKAWHLGMETEEEIPSYKLFSESEMEGLMGQNAFIHAAVLAGQAGEGVVKRAKMLEQYRNGGQSRAAGGAGRQKQ